MDYVEMCRLYFSITKIPVSLLKNDEAIYSAISETLSIPLKKFWMVFPYDGSHSLCFCRYSPDLENGRLFIEGTDYSIVLGPVFSIPVSEEIVRTYMHETAIPLSYKEAVTEFLSSIPRLSHSQFARHLIFLHVVLNHAEPDYNFIYSDQDLQEQSSQHVSTLIENQENRISHSTYQFELELYQYIKDGNPAKLADFLKANVSGLHEGRFASSPLRHTKNMFINVASKVLMLCAIPGGIDAEKSYQLCELYIQECEQLQSIDSIHALLYAMVMDFCQKIGEVKIPDGISMEVYQCMNYIRSHTNEDVTIEDAAALINRSVSYVTKRFKEELGINLGAYIMRCKLEEVKSLLTYTDKTLAEISSYLCFSSQSYFQNVFKKKYGITPTQYRKREKKLR